MKSLLCPLASSPALGIAWTTTSAGIPTQLKSSISKTTLYREHLLVISDEVT